MDIIHAINNLDVLRMVLSDAPMNTLYHYMFKSIQCANLEAIDYIMSCGVSLNEHPIGCQRLIQVPMFMNNMNMLDQLICRGAIITNKDITYSTYCGDHIFEHTYRAWYVQKYAQQPINIPQRNPSYNYVGH